MEIDPDGGADRWVTFQVSDASGWVTFGVTDDVSNRADADGAYVGGANGEAG